MVLNPRRVAAPVAAALTLLLAALAVVLASPGPAHAGPTPKPTGPAATVETPGARTDTRGGDGYSCTGGRPDRRCAPRDGSDGGYGSPSTKPPLTVPSPPAPSVTRSPSPSPSPAPELPKTGPGLTVLVVVGLLLIAGGWRLLHVSRRRPADPGTPTT